MCVHGPVAPLAAEVRLNATARFFDRIYLIEAWQPHSEFAPRKPVLFSELPYWRRVFARFGGKVTILVGREFPGRPVSWALQVRTL